MFLGTRDLSRIFMEFFGFYRVIVVLKRVWQAMGQ